MKTAHLLLALGYLVIAFQNSAAQGSSDSIHLTHIVDLGDDEGEGYIDATYNIIKDDNYYYVGCIVLSGEIRVFNHDGTFVKLLGKKGNGPGEYQYIRAMEIDTRGHIVVVDVIQSRMTLISQDHRVLGTVKVPNNIQSRGILAFKDTRYIINADQYTSSGIGYPMHVIDEKGNLLRSFGSDNSTIILPNYDPSVNSIRSMCIASESEIWVAHHSKYVIEKWNIETGRLVDSITMTPEWHTFDKNEEAPEPTIVDISYLGNNKLIIIGRTTDKKWRSAHSLDGEFDTVINVIDVPSRKIIAEYRMDEHPLGFITQSEIATFTDINTSKPRIRIWGVAVDTTEVVR